MTKEDALFFLMRFRRNGINEQLYDALGVAIEALKASAQADSKELSFTHKALDTISRQDAIDALNEYFARIGKLKRRGLTKGEKAISLDTVGIIKTLPSAQPEPLTDKEQRIFLAAMEREEKVCEEVDRNHVREPYEDSLMSVFREIKRKVKGALWT